MSSRDQSLRSDTWNLSGTQGNVFGNPRAVIDSSQTPYHGILHSWNQSPAGENPVRESTGRLFAKSEEQFRGTVLLPSTVSSFFPAEEPQNYVADPQRLQISSFILINSPTHSTLSSWKIRFNTQVSACSGSPGGDIMDQKKWR